MQQTQQYQLGPWVVCPKTNTISDKNDSHALDNKSMELLLLLIAHQGQPITKEQIFEQIWKGKVVANDILSVTISKIRKALGDNARSPKFIKTISGVGYVLIAEAKEVEADNPAQNKRPNKPLLGIFVAAVVLAVIVFLGYYSLTQRGSNSQLLNINSIAVLPFDDLSAQQDNQYFTDGLSDAIIDQLSQINSLKVISRYSSFTYRGEYKATDIGQALQVETLLDGSVQKIADQVRINVRIFSTQNGQQLWSKTFDGDSQDIFKLQDDISANIQAMIHPDHRPDPEPTMAINAQAYEWYLNGAISLAAENTGIPGKGGKLFQT